jgi:hypothetical protein
MALPNFLIVGFPKCGTTSLYNYLNQHPQIYMPLIKEPGFFTRAWPHLVKTVEDYKALFADVTGEIAIGEASPMYIEDPEVPDRIIDILGADVKIIIMIRNPIDRAYSFWGHLHYHSMVEPLSFEDALKAENDRHASEKLKEEELYYPGIFMYYRGGLYSQKIQQYLDEFGKENVKVIIFEEFVRNLEDNIANVYKFLDVDANFMPSLNQYNIANTPMNKNLQKVLSNPPKIIRTIYSYSPRVLKKFIYSIGKAIYWSNQKPRTKEAIHLEVRKDLESKFLEDVRSLELILERNLKEIWGFEK